MTLTLDKHMNKITIDERGVVILRPKYEKNAAYIQRARESINQWQKQTGTKLQVLIVPHDWDVLAIENPSEALSAIAATNASVTDKAGSHTEPSTGSPS